MSTALKTHTLFVRIAITSLCVVTLSLVAFLAIFFWSTGAEMERVVRHFQTQHIQVTLDLLRLGRADMAAQHLARLDESLGANHYLTDARGIDVISGKDYSGLLSTTRPRWGPPRVGDQVVIVQPSADGQHRLIVLVQPRSNLWAAAPYYALVVVALVALSWMLASGIALPIGQMAATVRRFGAGDLAVRVGSRRRDEIGELSRAFDDMASRLETLLTAERRLLQDVSHELRSPLARLTIAMELARTADDRQRAIDRMQKEVDRLSRLVDALVEVTRAEGEPAARHRQSVSLDALIQDVVDDCVLEADARPCIVRIISDASLVTVADRELLHRAVENVHRNAIRYAPPGSEVHLSLDGDAQEARITVRDFGPGVPDASLPHLAAPFYRVEAARDYSPEGSVGLGLSIAQRAVQVHGGSLTIANGHPGLRVTIRIPIRHSSQRWPPPSGPTSSGRTARSVRRKRRQVMGAAWWEDSRRFFGDD